MPWGQEFGAERSRLNVVRRRECQHTVVVAAKVDVQVRTVLFGSVMITGPDDRMQKRVCPSQVQVVRKSQSHGQRALKRTSS